MFNKTILISTFLALSSGVFSLPAQAQNVVDLSAHIEAHGDNWFKPGQQTYARRHEGFLLHVNIPGVSVEYDCHMENYGDHSKKWNHGRWVKEGSFCGTKGQSRRIESFAIRLTGWNASNYSIKYRCWQSGDWNYRKNFRVARMDGDWCGYKGISKPLVGMQVWIEQRSN